MQSHGFTAEQWAETPIVDRKIMHYARLVKSYIESLPIEKMKREAKQQQQTQRLLSKMPQLKKGR